MFSLLFEKHPRMHLMKLDLIVHMQMYLLNLPHRVSVALSSSPVHNDPFVRGHVIFSSLLQHAQ